jgi:D-alanyl-D-alanine carboxypeptidase/D-alanyl-D-alanine-endopeptidase (penicillin-binding protein 4)
MRGRLLPGLLGCLALLVLALPASAQPADTTAGSGAPGSAPPPTLVTPIFSARRVPALLRSQIADAQVADAVKAATKDEPPSSCVVVTDHGRLISALNAELPLAPASNNKMLTAVVALQVLGPDTKLRTRLLGPPPDANGVVNGDVYLVGGGDPLLFTEGFHMSREYKEQPFNDFNQMVAAVQAAHITQITGNIIGDDSRYDSQRDVPTWDRSYQKEEQVGALSALQVNWGETGLENDPNRSARNRKLGDPPSTATATLKTLLNQAGVPVKGQATAGAVPVANPPAELAGLDSMPIQQLVDEMLTYSDNNIAELLTKEVGLKATGRGTTNDGVATMSKLLTDMGLPVDGLNIIDGSGLDVSNRLTCKLLAALLDKEGPDSALAHGLPVMGQTGTLKTRLKGTFAVGRVVAKTGSLKDASQITALSGYEKTVPGVDLTFVTIQNGPSKRGIEVGDDLVNGLLAYPQAPDLQTIGPKPVA